MDKFYLDDLIIDEKFKIHITGSGIDFRAFLTEDTFSIAGSATYESKYEAMADNFIPDIAKSMAQAFMGIQLKTFESTVLEYIDSERPTFTVPVVLPSFDVVSEKKHYGYARDMLAALYPGGGSGGLLDRATVIPPNNYKAFDRPNGRVVLFIGNWFKAENLVIVSANFNYSKEVTPRDYPLYITGEITLRPDRLTSSDDIKGYFVK